MIRLLTEEDRQQTVQFVSQKPAENLFIIGDIEAYGFDNPVQQLWGDFTDSLTLRGVLLKYSDNYIAYGERGYDAEGFAEIINADPHFAYISGIESIVNEMKPYLQRKPKNPRVLYYAKCEQAHQLQEIPPSIRVVKAVPEDAARIVEQLKAIPEFSTSSFNVKRNEEVLRSGVGRTFYIEQDGRIVSSASTTAENSQSAMVVGVGTLPGYEKQGLATYCMSVLCAELLQEGKMLCLFYDNQKAGAIYKRIGFIDIGKWCMWTYED